MGRKRSTVTKLTARQHQVMELVCQGKTNKQIGGVLGISPHTVRHYINDCLDRLGAEKPVVAAILYDRMVRN